MIITTFILMKNPKFSGSHDQKYFWPPVLTSWNSISWPPVYKSIPSKDLVFQSILFQKLIFNGPLLDNKIGYLVSHRNKWNEIKQVDTANKLYFLGSKRNAIKIKPTLKNIKVKSLHYFILNSCKNVFDKKIKIKFYPNTNIIPAFYQYFKM